MYEVRRASRIKIFGPGKPISFLTHTVFALHFRGTQSLGRVYRHVLVKVDFFFIREHNKEERYTISGKQEFSQSVRKKGEHYGALHEQQ